MPDTIICAIITLIVFAVVVFLIERANRKEAYKSTHYSSRGGGSYDWGYSDDNSPERGGPGYDPDRS